LTSLLRLAHQFSREPDRRRFGRRIGKFGLGTFGEPTGCGWVPNNKPEQDGANDAEGAENGDAAGLLLM